MSNVLEKYLRAGTDSRAGRKTRNEDAVGIATPSAQEFAARGAVFAIADGVSGCERGDRAAQYAVRGVLNDYYATPDTWAPPIALDRVITAQNRWLRSQSDASLATTLSLLVLSGARYCIAHVGDTRVYRVREHRMELLTTDHVWNHPQMSHVLTRALGLDNSVAVDYCEGDWQAGDIFLLVCDGVWASVAEADMLRTLLLYAADPLNSDPAQCAKQLCEAAVAAGSEDNVSAVVVQCLQTPPESVQQRLAAGRQLMPPARLKTGNTIDGFLVEELLYESRESLVYRVTHPQHSGEWVLKTLSPLMADDENRRLALASEEWLMARMPSKHFAETLVIPHEKRNFLYLVQRFYTGATLARRQNSGHRYGVPEIVQIAVQLLRALGALHRLHVIHRDIKPENLHLSSDGVLRILDLGVAWHGNSDAESNNNIPGTPSYMAPELLRKEKASTQSDIYAAGVTLYHLLSKQYPYGEIEPFQQPKFGDPTPVTRHRHDVPLWLDDLLLKACARDVKDRFETAEEMLLALERGETHGLIVRRQRPLAERNPVALWSTVAVISLLLNFFLIYLLLVR
ncbi:MAG TPA: bifunctional protein-serine/threonine kinase/phosphatase [Pseudomonadales bacterium]|nr:bifunctional protein-serine/threonine kinase/phosphatase [Pseudomonadales bacterium]